MTEGVTGACIEHLDRAGVPCGRCGTFRCEGCLRDGLCPACRALTVGTHPPVPGEAEGFSRRFWARAVDVLATQAAVLAGGMGAGLALVALEAAGLARPGWMERVGGGTSPGSVLGALVISVAVATLSTAVCGASPGKVLLGLRVVDLQGRPPRLLAALLRELGYYVDGFVFGLVAYGSMKESPLRQRVGDKWAGTVVVRRATLRAPADAPAGRLLLGVGGGLALHALLSGGLLVLGAR